MSRRYYGSKDRRRLRRAVIRRDGNACHDCHASGRRVKLTLHHLIPKEHGGGNRIANLVLLCRTCHDLRHA